MTSNPINADMPDEAFQDHILKGVSRTFALTIPQLPQPLFRVVSNAYLLCRIADTIEDDKHMSFELKSKFSEDFINVVNASASPDNFANDLGQQLSPTATDDERDLIEHTPTVIRITHSFNNRQRAALERCIKIMSQGMTQYQRNNTKEGLKDQQDMDAYCYYVAGVVGEMLTELFCDYSEKIDKNRNQLMQLSVSFGQGLQMTNILKDIWDDQARGMCWLPRDTFQEFGIDISNLSKTENRDAFYLALTQLIGIARAHLGNALEYTLIIPPEEKGIRRFCLWAMGMAVLNLRKINNHRDYTSGEEVKISRRSVKATILVTNLLTRHDDLLRLLFNTMTSSLPGQNLSSKIDTSTKTA